MERRSFVVGGGDGEVKQVSVEEQLFFVKENFEIFHFQPSSVQFGMQWKFCDFIFLW